MRAAIWASHHEERGSDEVVAPLVGAPGLSLIAGGCLIDATPRGAAADAGHEAAARGLGAARAADDGVVDVP
jgi:hypothetical protein